MFKPGSLVPEELEVIKPTIDANEVIKLMIAQLEVLKQITTTVYVVPSNSGVDLGNLK